ncbi:MAG: sigma-70 family RNA polymerase sigma factor [Dehalococcoidales bacterium]|nr:sigma-70 family RNA polymerase sigma factor [Dehalococcoidales bacterium]
MPEDKTPYVSTDLEKLVERAMAGDSGAFGMLYDMHVDRVYRHIFYRVSSNADAEDLTQQVFIKAWQAIGRYQKTASPFLAWLIKISHNLVIDFYRSKKSESRIDFDAIATGPEKDPANIAEAAFNREYLRKAIRKLKGDQQQVILMRFIEDFSYPEIAAALGKSEGSIRVIQHRGLAKLRTILEKARQ